MANRKKRIKSPTFPANKLYVVLHGELAVHDDEDSDWICVYAPYMEEHVYLAGPWLGETHIRQGATLVLRGVHTDGAAQLRDGGDILLFKGGTCDPDMSYMEIRLPRPEKIWTDVTVELAGDIVVYGSAKHQFRDKAACCIVLTYSIKNGEIPALHSLGGMESLIYPAGITPNRCKPEEAKPNGCFSLHVFAEADMTIENGAHPLSAFRMAAGILGIDASTTGIGKDRTPRSEPTPLPKAETQWSLSGRQSELAQNGCVCDPPKPKGTHDSEYTCVPIGSVSGS